MISVITLLGLSAFAQQKNYEVLFSNSDKIMIGNQVAKKGLRFNDSKEIFMPTEECALEVRNLNNGTTVLIVGEKFNKHQAKTLSQYLIAERHLSTTSFESETVSWVFDTTYYMLNMLTVPSPTNFSNNLEIKAVIYFETSTFPISISKDDSKYIIQREDIGTCNQPFCLDIIEKDIEKNWEYAVWRKLYVVPLPLEIKTN